MGLNAAVSFVSVFVSKSSHSFRLIKSFGIGDGTNAALFVTLFCNFIYFDKNKYRNFHLMNLIALFGNN